MIRFKQKIFFLDPVTGDPILPNIANGEANPAFNSTFGERKAAAGLVGQGVWEKSKGGDMQGRSVTGIGNGVYEYNTSGGAKSNAYRDILGMNDQGLTASEQQTAQFRRDKAANQERAANLQANEQGHTNAAVNRYNAPENKTPQSTVIGNQVNAQNAAYHNQQQQKYNEVFGMKSAQGDSSTLSTDAFYQTKNDMEAGQNFYKNQQNQIYDQWEAEQKAKEQSNYVKRPAGDAIQGQGNTQSQGQGNTTQPQATGDATKQATSDAVKSTTQLETASTKKPGFFGKIKSWFNGSGGEKGIEATKTNVPGPNVSAGQSGLGYTGLPDVSSTQVKTEVPKRPGFFDGLRSQTDNNSIREAIGRNAAIGAKKVGTGIGKGVSFVGKGLKYGAIGTGVLATAAALQAKHDLDKGGKE